MKQKALYITETALMLALLIVLQWVTKPLTQMVTGSCVNMVLAVTVLTVGLGSGIAVAVLSPIFAYLLGIAPQLVTVPAIMVGNAVFVTVLYLVGGKEKLTWRKISALLAAALGKFGVMYVLVVVVICGVAADFLLAQGLLKAPMLNVLPTTFAAPQLVTALIGGSIAMLLVPTLKKALRRI